MYMGAFFLFYGSVLNRLKYAVLSEHYGEHTFLTQLYFIPF